MVQNFKFGKLSIDLPFHVEQEDTVVIAHQHEQGFVLTLHVDGPFTSEQAELLKEICGVVKHKPIPLPTINVRAPINSLDIN